MRLFAIMGSPVKGVGLDPRVQFTGSSAHGPSVLHGPWILGAPELLMRDCHLVAAV